MDDLLMWLRVACILMSPILVCVSLYFSFRGLYSRAAFYMAWAVFSQLVWRPA